MKNMEEFNEKDWLDRLYRKSNSNRTVRVAKTSMAIFDYFCEDMGTTRSKIEQEMREKMAMNPPDVRNVCLILDRYVNWLTKDHLDIKRKSNMKNQQAIRFKKKAPRTIDNYFVFLKSYLRLVAGVRLATEDIRDYVQFPKVRNVARKALPLDTIKIIFQTASVERRALYYVLVTSGVRIGEALALTKENFHVNENPIRISLDAEFTKEKEDRETYITSEAWDKVKPIYEKKGNNEPLFTRLTDIDAAVVQEDQYFGYLRSKLGLTERYKNSSRFVANIHALRSYFHTNASRKHGVEYANALDGHGAYLKQYYRLTEDERAQMYRELEPDLFIEASLTEADRTKDGIIADLKKRIELLEDGQKRDREFNKIKVQQAMR